MLWRDKQLSQGAGHDGSGPNFDKLSCRIWSCPELSRINSSVAHLSQYVARDPYDRITAVWECACSCSGVWISFSAGHRLFLSCKLSCTQITVATQKLRLTTYVFFACIRSTNIISRRRRKPEVLKKSQGDVMAGQTALGGCRTSSVLSSMLSCIIFNDVVNCPESIPVSRTYHST